MCMVCTEKINKGIQKFFMVSEPFFWNPNPFWPPLIQAIIHSGQVSLAISQSDHLSLWPSLIPAISPCSQSQGRKTESSSKNIHRRRLFRRTFQATSFSHTARSSWRRSPIFPKGPGPENHPRTGHARFFRPATASHVSAREGALATFRRRASSSSLAWRRLATLHTCFFHPSPARALVRVLLPPRALRTVFPASFDYFFSTPIPARSLGSVLLPFRWCHDCFSFLFGLSHGRFSIQIYFILQISGYGY